MKIFKSGAFILTSAITLLVLLTFSIQSSQAGSPSETYPAKQCLKMFLDLPDDDQIKSENQLKQAYQKLVDKGCLDKNPVLTTEVDIQTNSEECLLYGNKHNPGLIRLVNKTQNLDRIYIKQNKKFTTRATALLEKVNRLNDAGKKIQANRLMQKYRKLARKFKQFTKPIWSTQMVAEIKIQTEIINAFTEGCLEASTLKPARVRISKHYGVNINNAYMFDIFKFQPGKQREIEAKTQLNTVAKLTAIQVAEGRSLSWKQFKKEIKRDMPRPKYTIRFSTLNNVLEEKHYRTIHVTRYNRKSGQFCASVLLKTTVEEGVEKWYFDNISVSLKRGWVVQTETVDSIVCFNKKRSLAKP